MSAEGSLALGAEGWTLALSLGHLFGWRPAGTQRPAPKDAGDIDPALVEEWDGRCFDRHPQRVAADDAR